MPVQFLTPAQRAAYGAYASEICAEDLARYFHLDDEDRAALEDKRGDHNRLGYALQLTTARFLGTFLPNPIEVPPAVLQSLGRQLQILDFDRLSDYRDGRQRWLHTMEIRARYGFREWTEPSIGFRLSRWLYALCWTGTERPSILFERATAWLLANKVLLPGCTVLERFIAKLRGRVEERLWKLLTQGVQSEQRLRLENLLQLTSDGRTSVLDQLRTGPVRVSGPALVKAIQRLETVRHLGIKLPHAGVPPSRLSSLARFAATAKVSAVSRLPSVRRMATLVAFIHCLEASAQDDVIEILDALLQEIFNNAAKADRKARLRSLKDLDQAATTLAKACKTLLNADQAEIDLGEAIFGQISRSQLIEAVANVESLVRPPDDIYFQELDARYRAVRIFLPALLKHIHFKSSLGGEAVTAALKWMRSDETEQPPQGIVTKAWQRHVLAQEGGVQRRAYTFCLLDALQKALRRRDVFVSPSWRYSDPRAGLLAGSEWETARPVICRGLGLSVQAGPALATLSAELDETYRRFLERVEKNPSVRFEATEEGKPELILSPLDRLDEPETLITLRKEVLSRLPEVDLPELLLEISSRTGFTEAYTHLTEGRARAKDLTTSLCAVLLAEACNTGPGPLIREDIPALTRDRLAWVDQNYLRDETHTAANNILVAAQSQTQLAKVWGGGEVASADGLRFTVPVRTVHAGTNPKYFGFGRGVTWYNLLSDQCSGLNGITVPGTLRDSLVLLALVLEQETELRPSQIMTDTGAYSDVVFGLFRVLGYRFSPRLADIGGARFWRVDPQADYGPLNWVSRHRVSLQRLETNWDDLLRLAGSLKLGRVPATGIMRTLQVGDQPTQLALALADLGRIDKTIHVLNYIDDENRRRATLQQLNRTESRHSLARNVFHGKRGELRQRYREGQEDQLGALGLVVNTIVLWNTIYMDAALAEIRREGTMPVLDEDAARLSPFAHDHVNLLGRYNFAVPEAVTRGELRPLRRPGA